MAPTMKIQNYLKRILFSLIILASVCKGQLFAQTGQPLLRSEDTVNHEVKLPNNIQFPFRGSRYSSLYVSKDGLVGFHPSTVYSAEDYSKYLTKEDPAFAAPFYFPAQDIGTNLGGKPYTGQVLFRYGPSTEQFNIPADELGNYSAIIHQSVVGIDQFAAEFGLIVTWKNVISRSDVEKGCSLDTANLCKNNTFQIAMLTDGNQSFAIFNYINMDIAVGRYMQSGFNAGDGRGYTTALNDADLKQAHNSYGSDVIGRYIYRIDTEQIVHGGCSNSRQGQLSINPKYAGMFGGKMLDISGPCMLANTQPIVKCRFGGDNNLVTYGYKVNAMRVRCSVPWMSIRGWVKVELSLDNQQFLYSSNILIVHPGRVSMKEMISLPYNGPLTGWNETTTNRLTMTWDSKQLTDTPYSLLNISLMGYRETRNGVILQNLKGLGSIAASINRYSFDTDTMCVGMVCNDFEIGFVMAELQDKRKATTHRYLVSSVLPLGFYVNKAMVMQYGENWPSQKCKAWYNEDKKDMKWLSKLQHCPCNLVQALSDFGRWQTDVGCDLYDGSKCTYHIGAVHCIRSVQPTSDGAGNQCCYDKGGNLKFAADSFQGSTPDRSHTWGAAPYGSNGLVPSMSHWIKDVVTFYYCCLWTGYNDCDYYMDQRPTRDCADYHPPTPAIVYGQGHIQTFDGKHHRMCAEGDFLLMKSTVPNVDVVTVQGRFYKNVFPTIVGERGNSSVMLTNVAVRVGTETVEIRLKLPTADRTRRHLDVLVNQKYYFFDNKQTYWQDFKKFAVVNSDTKGMEANFTIILQNGLGIQISDCNMTLCVLVMAPPSLMGQVEGLLGNFNGNASDDLMSTDPNFNKQVASGKAITLLQQYQMMQFRCAVNNTDTIMPMNIQANINDSMCSLKQPNRNLATCNGNMECLFDYRATGDSNIALQTLTMSQRIVELRSFVAPVRSCGLLNVPRSIKSNYNYKLGNSVTIQGCRVGSRQGDVYTYTCISTGNNTQSWSPSVSTTCSANVDKADTAMVVGIVVGVLAFFVILVALGFLIRKIRKGSSNKSSSDKYGASKNPDSEGSDNYSANYSRPHKPYREPYDDIDTKPSNKEYSL